MLLVVILCLMNNPLIFAPSSILVPQSPSDAVFYDLLDVLASQLAQGKSRVDDNVGCEFLPLAELFLVCRAGIVCVLLGNELWRKM